MRLTVRSMVSFANGVARSDLLWRNGTAQLSLRLRIHHASSSETYQMPKIKDRKKQLKAAVQRSDPALLGKLVLDLAEISKENRAFVEARLAATPDPLKPYKERIEDALYPDAFSNQPIRIGAARRAVTEYRKAAGDPNGLLELMIYYVERGTACTADYGDIDESFYDSLESMYDRFLTALEKAGPAAKEAFRARAEGVVTRATGMGWGYYDYLADRFAEAYPE